MPAPWRETRCGARWAGLDRALVLLAVIPALASGLTAQQAQGDSGFAGVQERGRVVMGVDQYSSAHRFDDLPDGGRIELRRDPADTAGVRTLREHLAQVVEDFRAGDFTKPFAVHASEVPGSRVMRSRRDRIRYRFVPLAGGGVVRIQTTDPDAVRAVHEFLAFQRRDHRAPGHQGQD